MIHMITGTKDRQKVRPTGEEIIHFIDGVSFVPAVTHIDDRGSLTQIPKECWKEAVTDAHQVTIRSGKVKGWIMHKKQEDRLFFWEGDFRAVLFDSRELSSTKEKFNIFYIGAQKPGLLRIPSGVFHAIQNLGGESASHLCFPTTPYDFEDPDKFRLPIDTKEIPYDFFLRGW